MICQKREQLHPDMYQKQGLFFHASMGDDDFLSL